jgi:hypothetical protein
MGRCACRRNAEDGEGTELTARELSRLQSHFVKTVLVMLCVHIAAAHHPRSPLLSTQ